MTLMHTRNGRPDDLDAILKLYRQWMAEENTIALSAPSRQQIKDWPSNLLMVAEADGAIVGFAHAVSRVKAELGIFPTGTPYLDVDSVYVDAAWRNQGIGGQLLDAVMELGQQAGIERCYVFSAANDQRSIVRFYEQHGFQPWGVLLFR